MQSGNRISLHFTYIRENIRRIKHLQLHFNSPKVHLFSKVTKNNELFLREASKVAVKNTKSSAGLSGTGCWRGHLVTG